ncbi:hypothetical protein E2562_002151 [Oryza meyeriana var. granulata]|uniref:Uncharacterized protein n=1 Tax=Oryza meyeriana var. granulata TaxID=110450 RepID=A0A6G1EER0_9ORYZ|nr:hypothetical protein E2562_002151 [Oryza meyeriana var. granulata]
MQQVSQHQHHHHHHHNPKPPVSRSSSWIRRSPPQSPPHKKLWGGGGGGGGRSRYVCRLVPLLVLTVYSIFTVVRIPSSSLVVSTADSERVERREDVEAFKTHLPSNQNNLEAREETRSPASLPCSALINGEAGGGQAAESALCCDRSHYRSDVCYLRGDVRTDPSTSSVLLYNAPSGSAPEKVRPYTRKFEDSIMSTIDEVTIVPVVDTSSNGTTGDAAGGGKDSLRRRCDVRHPPGVPAVVFSTGGYTGNVYHEFSDGLIPLFITAQRFAGEVVFVVLEYHYWWLGRYGAVLERLTNYKIVDFRYDRRVHCFSEMIVGLRIHGELVVDPKLMPNDLGLAAVKLCVPGVVNHTITARYSCRGEISILVSLGRKTELEMLHVRGIVLIGQACRGEACLSSESARSATCRRQAVLPISQKITTGSPQGACVLLIRVWIKNIKMVRAFVNRDALC